MNVPPRTISAQAAPLNAIEVNMRAGLRLAYLGAFPALAVLALILVWRGAADGLVIGGAAIPFSAVSCLALVAVYRPLTSSLRRRGSSRAIVSAELARWSPLWLGVALPFALASVSAAVMVTGVVGAWLALASRLAWLHRREVLAAASLQDPDEFLLRTGWVLRWDLFVGAWGATLLTIAIELAEHDTHRRISSTLLVFALGSLICLYWSTFAAIERDPMVTRSQLSWGQLSWALLIPPLVLKSRADHLVALAVAIGCIAAFVAINEGYRRHGRRMHEAVG